MHCLFSSFSSTQKQNDHPQPPLLPPCIRNIIPRFPRASQPFRFPPSPLCVRARRRPGAWPQTQIPTRPRGLAHGHSKHLGTYPNRDAYEWTRENRSGDIRTGGLEDSTTPVPASCFSGHVTGAKRDVLCFCEVELACCYPSLAFHSEEGVVDPTNVE